MYFCDNETIGYTWRKEWILPYESLWGITEKFKYLNSLSNLKCKNFSYKNAPRTYEPKEDYEAYIFCDGIRYNSSELAEFLHIDYKAHFSLLNIFKENALRTFLVEHLRICPQCMRYGYHSYLHQVIFEDNCFLHREETLIDTDIPYSVTGYNQIMYEIMPELKGIIVSPIDMLDELMNTRKLHIPRMEEETIQNIRILNFNDVMSGSKFDYAYLYLRAYFHKENDLPLNGGRVVYCKSKETMEKKWPQYNFSRSWIHDYCYSFSNKLLVECNEEILERNRRLLSSSYATYVLERDKINYDLDCIAKILTIAKITGYEDDNKILQIFSYRWKLNLTYCIHEFEFDKLICISKKTVYKVAYVELYKRIINYIYNTFVDNGQNGAFSYVPLRYLNLHIKFPVYIIMETQRDIKIVEIPS